MLQTCTHLPVDVSAVTCGETLHMKRQATLVAQAFQEPSRTFILSIIHLLILVTVQQHNHVALWWHNTKTIEFSEILDKS